VNQKTPNAEDAAKVLGMKPEEVTDVQLDADGTLAQTKDGHWTLIRDSGTLEHLGQDLGERVEDEPAEEPKKAAPAPKARN
jgi:hypothetical protein